MPINFVTGLPRQGKTLFTFIQVKERAEKENRPVYYCNIPEVSIPGWTEIKHPDEWMTCPNDSIIIVDELQDFWGLASSGAKVPLPILELSKHGKRGIDFYFITQDPRLVHTTPRHLCEYHWHVVRAFGTENAVAHKWRGMQTDPEKVKGKSEKYPWRYPKEAFGKKDKAGNWISRPWYKSADVHNIKREIPLKIWAIPGGLLLAGLAVYAAVSFLSGAVDKAKNNALGAVPADSVAKPPAQRASAAVGSGQPMTAAEYVASRVGRLPSFPHTAPAYDQVTQPTVAPYPAACVSMRGDCRCYTQQATLMQTPHAVCMQIVKEGFFVDWRQLAHEQPRGNGLAVAPSVPASAPPGPQPARVVPMPEFAAQPSGVIAPSEVTAALRLRNPMYLGNGGGMQ